MPEAEGRIFHTDTEDAIDAKILETIEFDNKEDQLVTCGTDEFSAVCPFSGLPDIGRVVVEYVPDKKIIELKSLKYYYMSFRNVGIYQERATQRIFGDLQKVLDPKWMKITVTYNIRGGIDVVTEIESDGE